MSSEEWYRGTWMQTFTGKRFYPLAPLAEEIDPIDIAHALSQICRYGGHARRFYSVAEHCVLMSNAVAPEHALWALLHDATEAYVGDMVRPLKIHMPEYREVEDRVMVAVAERFGLDGVTMPPAVKDADNRILLSERAVVMTPTEDDWSLDVEPLDVRIRAWQPAAAELMYLDRLTALGVL